MTREELVGLLAAHKTIGSAPRQELRWIAEHGRLCHFEQGEIITRETKVVDSLHILLSGVVAIYVKRGTSLRRTMEWRGGDVTGVLPYSRLTTPPGNTYVEEPTDSVVVSREELPELIRNCYETTSILVHVMTDRARRFTSTDLRDEKMISLGKLAAGFAHEINNPASAALRDAKSLEVTLSSIEEATRALCGAAPTGEMVRHLNALLDLTHSTSQRHPLSGIELADREEEMAAWLGARGLSTEMGAELAGTPVTVADLERLSSAFPGSTMEHVLRWVTATYAARSLVANIERATTRIHGLVTAAKGFTHMDRARELEPVILLDGLRDTVALLEGKAKGKSVHIVLNVPADLPPIRGYAGEINQVWMNLIDNAIDAAPRGGHVAVTASLEGAEIQVCVIDDGSGIPADILENIFDPFFTTKAVGEGTGLGLDIARRVVHEHNGEIIVQSQVGRTELRVKLPISGAG